MLTIQVSDEEFKKLGDLIYSHFGINLTSEKKRLLEGRFQSLLKKHKLNSFSEYYNFLLKDKSLQIERLGELVDKISTNHTYFYREPKHFQLMENTWLPELIQTKKDKKIRIWCAASSSGEEPYTLLSILYRVLGEGFGSWDSGVLATDISSVALSKAKQGLYNQSDVEALPKSLITPVFEKVPKTGQYRVKENIKKDILFRRFNLMNPFPFKSKFDIVFCRNVMIYFDKATTLSLVERIYSQLNVGGYLIISLSESLIRDETKFKYISPGVYKKE